MMTPNIVDLRALAAQDFITDSAAESWLDKLVSGLMKLPQDSDSDLAEQVRDRADAYAELQPSFAADLRAALEADELQALA